LIQTVSRKERSEFRVADAPRHVVHRFEPDCRL
jgi:hypothetical protein